MEEFVTRIPGLYESEAFTFTYHGETTSDIRSVLAALPRAAYTHVTLSWSIIWLAQRAITRNLSKPIQRRRVKTCLRALYYIPGAIRDLLASYAACKHYCLEILPLLNSPESLEIIEELWDSPNDDVVLSVRCAAATIASFMITPPRHVLECFLPPDVRLIGDEDVGQQFLANRLRVGALLNRPRGASERLQNIICFLAYIKDTLGYMITQWWLAGIEGSIPRERRVLFETRHTDDYRTGRGTFDNYGNRASPQFIPAAQQDLITLTLEILARDTVATAAREQRHAFREACQQLGQVVAAQARASAQVQTRVFPQSSRAMMDAWAFAQEQAADSIDMVRHALEPVLLDLRVQMPAPRPHVDDHAAPAPQMPVPQIGSSAPPAIVCPEDTPGQAPVGSAPRPPPPPFILQDSMMSSMGLATAVTGLGNSPVQYPPGPSGH